MLKINFNSIKNEKLCKPFTIQILSMIIPIWSFKAGFKVEQSCVASTPLGEY